MKITTTQLGDVRIVVSMFHTMPESATSFQKRFHVTAFDCEDDEIYCVEFDTFALALADVHRFSMSEYAGSIYAEGDASAYEAFA